jgi:hypothetical protein
LRPIAGEDDDEDEDFELNDDDEIGEVESDDEGEEGEDDDEGRCMGPAGRSVITAAASCRVLRQMVHGVVASQHGSGHHRAPHAVTCVEQQTREPTISLGSAYAEREICIWLV